MPNIYESLILAIIKQQELIVGPMAWSEAKKVSGLDINNNEVKINIDGKAVLKSLVEQYATLFGQASVEVCKDAIKEIQSPIKSEELPSILI